MDRHSPDVAIIGAGLIGVSIAWRLAQAGARVTLLEAGTVGGEASSAGAGMLSPGGEFHKPSVWLDLGVAGAALYPAFVEELRGQTGLPIDFAICGSLQIAHTGEEREHAELRAAFQTSAGIRSEMTPEGLFYPDDAFVDPVDLLRALRRACEGGGVRIEEGHGVEEIEADRYGALVVAAGAWSGQIRVRFHEASIALPDTEPIKGHLLGFRMPPGSLGPMRRHGHTYVLQRSNGFTIAGSTEERRGFDRSIDLATCEDIHKRAAGLVPALAAMPPAERWIGFRPRAVDGEGPRIGRVDGTNVWLAYGHYRNGILLAPWTARRIAGEIAGTLKSASSGTD